MNDPAEPQPIDRRTLYALIAGAVILIAVIIYFATRGSTNQDRIDDGAAFEAPADAEASAACSGTAINDRVKQALFRNAAAARDGVDQTYAKIADAAFIRMENAALEAEAADGLQCTGSVSIQLPPGIVASGGRRNLMGNVDYTVSPDGGGVSIRDDSGLTVALSGLTRSSGGVSGTLSDDNQDDLFAAPAEAADPNSSESPVGPPAPGVAAGTGPSFNCANARTPGEQAVCSDSALANLDRTMARQYRGAVAAANSQQALLLRETRDRFLAYRDGCPNAQCMRDAYTGRMREIRDIMEGRWKAPR